MKGSVSNFCPEYILEYPYDQPQSIRPQFVDFYNRSTYLLLSSLARYGHMIQYREAIVGNQTILRTIPTITCFCEGTTLPEDLNILMVNFPPTAHETRYVFDAHILDDSVADLFATLGRTQLYDQIIFYHQLRPNSFAIYVVLWPKGCIEGYIIGDAVTPEITTMVVKLQAVFAQLHPNAPLTFRRRLELPPTPVTTDTVALAYILVQSLHLRRKYLDLNFETGTLYKLSILGDFIECHDQWLGKLQVDVMTKKTHPFLATSASYGKNLEELEQLGWAIVDVVRDGNCGYYSLILGLENIGNMDYSVQNHQLRDIPMSRNKPWQFNVLKLRHNLQRKSQELITTMYPPGSRARSEPWFLLTNAVTDTEIANLSKSCYSEEIPQNDFFNGTLLEGDDFNVYHMHPYWGAHVFSCLFCVRVVVYTQNSRWDGVEARPFWSTTVLDHNAPIISRIEQRNILERLTDREFKRIPTIEIVYTTGFGNNGQPIHNHFQFLRRVLCNIVPQHFPDTPNGSLRDFVVHPDQHDLEDQLPGVAHTESVRNVENNRSELHTASCSSRGKTAAKTNKRLVQRKVSKQKKQTKHQITKEQQEKNRQYTIFFNEQYEQEKLKHKTPTLMFYDPLSGRFFIRNKDANGKLQRKQICYNLDDYDKSLIDAARSLPETWVGPSLGDQQYGTPPPHLATKIITLYQQHNDPYCLTYSLASALFYCGFRWQGEGLYGEAERISNLHCDKAIEAVRT